MGYGDIHALTVFERLFCVVAMVIGGFIFGMLIRNVPVIMDKKSLATRKYAEMEANMHEFVKANKIPSHLVSSAPTPSTCKSL